MTLCTKEIPALVTVRRVTGCVLALHNSLVARDCALPIGDLEQEGSTEVRTTQKQVNLLASSNKRIHQLVGSTEESKATVFAKYLHRQLM